MEQLFGPEELDVLDAHIEANPSVRRETWHRSSIVAPAWEMLAVKRLADRLQYENGGSRKDAVMAASIALRLAPDTIEQRLKRARRAARELGGKLGPRQAAKPVVSSIMKAHGS